MLIGLCISSREVPGPMNWICAPSRSLSDPSCLSINAKEYDMSTNKIFLYAEIQVAIPFGEIDWRSINTAMQKEPGLKSKTWLSGINTNTIGGVYEFDSLENAKAYAVGYLAAAAKHIGGTLSVEVLYR